MSIILDPSKEFVTISVLYIEEYTKHGNSLFHFVRSAEDLAQWKTKGYVTIAEVEKAKLPETDDIAGTRQPGVTVQSKSAFKYDPKKVIESVETSWKRPTWKDHNLLYSRCFRQIPDGKGGITRDFDGIMFRDLKLKTFLKRWNVRDESGAPVPVSDNTIDNLVPEVATELLAVFEKITEISAEDLKN